MRTNDVLIDGFDNIQNPSTVSLYEQKTMKRYSKPNEIGLVIDRKFVLENFRTK